MNSEQVESTERAASDRVDQILELAEALRDECETLASALSAHANLKRIDLAAGIDFYEEVKRFETSLIKSALEKTGGNQVRAARMLGLKTSTLHLKRKVLKIDLRSEPTIADG